jgi:hypothetical protein
MGCANICLFAELDSVVAGNQRQEEFYANVRIGGEIVPIKEKAAHGLRGLIKKAQRNDY